MLKRRITLAAAATGAAALFAVAGCGSASQPLQVNLAAAEVLEQAAQKTQSVTSYTVDAVVNVTHPQQGSGKVQGRMLYQNQPQLAVDVTLDTVSFGGRNVPGEVRAVLQGDVLYVKVEALKQMLGATKPWIRVDLAQAGSAAEVNKYLDQVRQFDLATVTQMVTASQDVKAVGTESVNGEDATRYSGTFPVEAALQQLPADQRERARPTLAELKDVKFDIWVGADGLPRKLALNGSKEGATLDATLFFKGFNQPVTVQTPPADQVGELNELSRPSQAPTG
ncbi:LppX_LprAFG lipoprotein [Thermoactinospora rubra]|uniref:LppX_LprAFG lipoprotein n=1 Tax=Thermoactinospora rubra TaxID=1088767 RepID=UPI001F0A7C48|nr:LppX_LprAFG lipoprotein [Thermoactinospora rubra]